MWHKVPSLRHRRAEQRKEIQSSKNQKLGQNWDKSAKNICLWVVCPPLQAEGHRFEPYNSHQKKKLQFCSFSKHLWAPEKYLCFLGKGINKRMVSVLILY